MKSRTYSSEGIILSRRNYKEADRIISLFSKKYGKVVLVAKGVRKLQSRKRGHIEIFSNIKFIASKTNSIDIITEAELINDYGLIRKNLNKATLAYYFCEVIEKITREAEPIEKIYLILDLYLKKVETNNNLKQLRLNFIKDVLEELGFWSENENILNADVILDEVLERKINSLRVGKKVLST